MTEAAATERRPFLARLAAEGRELGSSGPVWLREFRARGMARFEEIGFPTTRLEEWKTTSVEPIANTEFHPAPAEPAGVPDLPDSVRIDLGGPRLVFVDGRFSSRLSDTKRLPEGVEVARLADAVERHGDSLLPYFEPRDLARAGAFEALNAALASDGAFVRVGDGVRLERPIHVVWLSSAGATPVASWPRTIVVAGRDSEAEVVESWAGMGDGVSFAGVVSDAFVADGAVLRHARLQFQGSSSYQVSTLGCRQARDSRYVGWAFDLGGRLVRHDLTAVLDGEGADCRLWGLYLTRGEQHVDHHTILDHAQPHGGSREVYKGVLAGKSRTVFNGRIIVRKGAQKTDAKQSNPNLLLSGQALAQTRPQLEIHADDVKCTHGATVGRLDEDAVFYLRARGIGEAEARSLLVRAFAGEILDTVVSEPLRAHVERAVDERLASRSTP